MNSASLAVTTLKSLTPEAAQLRQKYAKLLGRLPGIAIEYLGCDPQVEAARAKAVTNLVALHAGEVVDIAPVTKNLAAGLVSWTLRPCSERAATMFCHSQLQCRPDTKELGQPDHRGKDEEYGAPCHLDCILTMQSQCQAAARQSSEMDASPMDYQADFGAQSNRVMVPCRRASSHCWFRTGSVITLGGLFMALGTEFDAASLYEYYVLLRIVAVKRRRLSQKRSGTRR